MSGASGSFGKVTVGTRSAPQTFTITNSGQGPVQIAATELAGSDADQYSLSGCDAQTLNTGESCNATVRFTPASTGEHDAATLRVASDAASGPNVAELSGTGVAVVPPPPPAAGRHATTAATVHHRSTIQQVRLSQAPRPQDRDGHRPREAARPR